MINGAVLLVFVVAYVLWILHKITNGEVWDNDERE